MGTFLGTVVLYVFTLRIGIEALPKRLHRDTTVSLLRKSILPGLANTMNMQTTRPDIIALERRKDADAVGFFAAAFAGRDVVAVRPGLAGAPGAAGHALRQGQQAGR